LKLGRLRSVRRKRGRARRRPRSEITERPKKTYEHVRKKPTNEWEDF
jgi:hypothetical protein